jgi:hypothetical protein
LSVLGAVLLIGAILAFVLPLPDTTVTASVVTTTTLPCSSSKLTSEAKIDQCLVAKIRVQTAQMSSLLRDESVFFRYASTAQDWRVAQRTQSECLSEANPYQPGTIVPVLYGECVIGFYNQRVVYLRHAIASFKKGGEAQAAS